MSADAPERLAELLGHVEKGRLLEDAIIYAYGLPDGGLAERHRWFFSDIRALLDAERQPNPREDDLNPPQGSKGWRPIATAPRTVEGEAAEAVILGFAPDEEGYSPTSREGFWNPDLNRWSSTLDPSWSDSPQPTHWQPLPAPPLEVGEDIVSSSVARLDASCAPPESGGQAGGGEP